MSLAALNLQTEPTSPPSDRSESPQDTAEPESREWIKLTDVCLAFLQGAPQVASWMPVSLVILSVPDLAATTPRSTWYLMLVPQDPANQQTHTIDLSIRLWRVYSEELQKAHAIFVASVL
ncbi:hypothetical protein GSI_11966 [Ganoderma sinense ZZ0214-1]|uniref:Uncharacterized protein n=1 Tax=Ganoderma sinense ZZ0214-1 TaxID=1077348 RepID=A0A2G8RXH2_9APHY|nr:hypothetical protein GSI_11966 [Ganoderma sinense ZZ0214-1]